MISTAAVHNATVDTTSAAEHRGVRTPPAPPPDRPAGADGVMDEAEERAVLDRLRGADLSQEEKLFLVDELHRPKPIEELAAGITDLAVARTLYLLAATAVAIDTEAERAWFDRLARQLGLSREMQAFLEEQAG